MLEEGVVEEVRALLARPVSPEARKALGLAEVERLLAGEIARAEAAEAIALRTRRFAKKQATFFRSFAGVRWLDVEAGEDAASVAARALDDQEATSA
jgi:tRNA dimethylallyltransferase